MFTGDFKSTKIMIETTQTPVLIDIEGNEDYNPRVKRDYLYPQYILSLTLSIYPIKGE